MVDTCNAVAKGDLSTFMRDWMGSLIPIGYQKDIGFEYQYTSERGFEAGCCSRVPPRPLQPTPARAPRATTPIITR